MIPICLVTGANGFVGAALMDEIHKRSCNGSLNLVCRGAVRARPPSYTSKIGYGIVGEINARTNWREVLSDVNVIVHTAARAHVLKDNAQDPLTEFRSVNVEGTVNLAKQALQAGVRRFIYISSIGVNGNQTFGHPFDENDPVNPQDSYAISKFEAETALRVLLTGSQTELVIIRPPLVYGPNPPGNFLRLLKLVSSGIPVPLGAVCNQRSLVGLDNLVDFILCCIDHPAAADQIFLVSDGEDVSTTDLLCRMGDALGKPARLIPVPTSFLEAGAALLGRRDMVRRLCGSLQVDISKARTSLGWIPPISVDEGLRRTARGYLHEKTV